MKFLAFSIIVGLLAIGSVQADGTKIVEAARSQIGTPYSWGGGEWNGKGLGTRSGAHIVGFDCSGLAQYSVYQGTGKKIRRVSRDQYNDPQCHHVPFEQSKPGDLVFFELSGVIHHVAINSGGGHMIHAPTAGDHVRESPMRTKGRVANVQRCF